MKSKTLRIALTALFTATAVPAFAEGYGGDDRTPPTYAPGSGPRYEAPRYEPGYDPRYDPQPAYDPPVYDARDYRNRGDVARVIDSRPVYAESLHDECWNPRAGHYEEVRNSKRTGIKGAAIGAVAGGVIGHQVDHGGGTAVGAILGGLIGNQIEKRNNEDQQNDLDRSRCRVVSDGMTNDVQAYDVRYEYSGRQYTTRLASDPGRRLRLGEEIRPDGRPYDAYVRNDRPNR